MSARGYRIAVVVAVLAAAGTVLALKALETGEPSARRPLARASASGRPQLIELGGESCLLCRQMQPVLREVARTAAGRLEVRTVNVYERPEAVTLYGIEGSAIPVLLFLTADGRELHRHVGAMTAGDILATWRRLGYDFGAAPASAPAEA